MHEMGIQIREIVIFLDISIVLWYNIADNDHLEKKHEEYLLYFRGKDVSGGREEGP